MKKLLHCLRCKNFLKCKRRFDARAELIYGLCEIKDNKFILSNPIICIDPLHNETKND